MSHGINDKRTKQKVSMTSISKPMRPPRKRKQLPSSSSLTIVTRFASKSNFTANMGSSDQEPFTYFVYLASVKYLKVVCINRQSYKMRETTACTNLQQMCLIYIASLALCILSTTFLASSVSVPFIVRLSVWLLALLLPPLNEREGCSDNGYFYVDSLATPLLIFQIL